MEKGNLLEGIKAPKTATDRYLTLWSLDTAAAGLGKLSWLQGTPMQDPTYE